MIQVEVTLPSGHKEIFKINDEHRVRIMEILAGMEE